ncbi:MAG: hypothetical protein PHR61_03650 [Candidatus Absconditabacteria bacterium]|nr:hypothetical protein [Candidatus Absconditabacteria bacterium]
MAVMKKFEASSASIKVNGETILSFVKAVPASEDSRRDILKKHGINDPKPGQWYIQQDWLNAFKEISEKVGIVTLKLIGKAIPKNAKFPPQIKETKEAFEMLDKAYKMNHKGGFIVEYKFLSFDPQKKRSRWKLTLRIRKISMLVLCWDCLRNSNQLMLLDNQMFEWKRK